MVWVFCDMFKDKLQACHAIEIWFKNNNTRKHDIGAITFKQKIFVQYHRILYNLECFICQNEII